MRYSPLATAIVALTISLTYLAATFVDCERPSLLPSRSVAVENEAPHHAGASHHAAPAAKATAFNHNTAPHDTTASHHATAPHHAIATAHHSAAPDPAPAVLASHEAGHVMTDHAMQSPAWAGVPIELAWLPTCLCGCSETRSLAANAGGALGAVAFVDKTTAMLTEVRLRPTTFYVTPDLSLDLPPDPIPI